MLQGEHQLWWSRYRQKGETKEYRTSFGIGLIGYEPGYPEKYVTKCGMEWQNEPEPYEECNHLDCAMHLAEHNKKNGLFLVISFIVGGFVFILPAMGANAFLVSSTLPAFWFLYEVLRARKQLKELHEFKNNGTINGIKANQIHWAEMGS